MKLIQNKRTITWRPVKRLDQQLEPNSDAATGTDHSHSNIALLDSLSMDSNGRLKSSGQLINIPLIQEEW